jgi:hypothetical protein
MPDHEFSPTDIARILNAHGVDYVVVGGLAAAAHGAAHVTFDIDITPELSRRNLDHLSSALSELHARIRTDAVEGGLPFEHDGESLRKATVWNLTTDYGDLDLTMMPAGTTGYDDVARDAVRVVIMGVEVPIASLADVIRSKEAADRPKDRLALPDLRRALEVQQRRDRP